MCTRPPKPRLFLHACLHVHVWVGLHAGKLGWGPSDRAPLVARRFQGGVAWGLRDASPSRQPLPKLRDASKVRAGPVFGGPLALPSPLLGVLIIPIITMGNRLLHKLLYPTILNSQKLELDWVSYFLKLQLSFF